MPNGDITTNEIMEFLQENMVTKADAVNFVTKDDLKNYATKDDLVDLKLDLRNTEQRILDHIDDKLADLKSDLVVSMS